MSFFLIPSVSSFIKLYQNHRNLVSIVDADGLVL